MSSSELMNLCCNGVGARSYDMQSAGVLPLPDSSSDKRAPFSCLLGIDLTIRNTGSLVSDRFFQCPGELVGLLACSTHRPSCEVFHIGFPSTNIGTGSVCYQETKRVLREAGVRNAERMG